MSQRYIGKIAINEVPYLQESFNEAVQQNIDDFDMTVSTSHCISKPVVSLYRPYSV